MLDQKLSCLVWKGNGMDHLGKFVHYYEDNSVAIGTNDKI